MGACKTEVNLRRRLLVAAPEATEPAEACTLSLREQLEQLAEERTPQGLPRIAKVTIIDYSKMTEEIAANLVATPQDIEEAHESFVTSSSQGSSPRGVEDHITPSPGLRRRAVPSHSDERAHKDQKDDPSGPIRLDGTAQAHIEKHGKLQEDLTDEMVGLGRQLKESGLCMNQSVQNTEKILDSTERSVERSLASTGRVNVRAGEIYSRSSKTTCFQWLLMFVMTMVFIMVVLLIRVT